MTIRDIVREILDEESAAAKAAKKAGLVHLGFGRYGPKKGDKATHVSKDGKLVDVGDDKPQMGPGQPSGDKPQMGLKPFKTKATKFGGGTGVDADFLGEPPVGSREPDDEPSHPDDMDDRDVFQFLNKDEPEDEYPDKDPINTKKGEMEDEMEDIAYKLDNVTDPEERKELEAEYDKIDQELYDINKKQYGDDSGYEKSGRTGKELDQ